MKTKKILDFCGKSQYACEYRCICETINIYFNLNSKECYFQISRIPIDEELYEEILKGNIIHVYTFESDRLEFETLPIED